MTNQLTPETLSIDMGESLVEYYDATTDVKLKLDVSPALYKPSFPLYPPFHEKCNYYPGVGNEPNIP